MNKSESNRINALKSTGPKTTRGKQFSRQNARRHGLFSCELLVSDHDRPEFEELRGELASQLKPKTPLQEIAFQSILSCCWRCKLAHRLEAKQIAMQLRDSEDKNIPTPESEQNRYVAQWWGMDRIRLRNSIRELKRIEEEFGALGYFNEDTKLYLARTFGADFVMLLTEWMPMCMDAFMLANQLVGHAQTFGLKSLDEDRTPRSVARDPQQSFQMIGKLLDLQGQFLEGILRLKDQKSTSGGDQVQFEFNPRFSAAANRELQHAVDCFLNLRANNL